MPPALPAAPCTQLIAPPFALVPPPPHPPPPCHAASPFHLPQLIDPFKHYLWILKTTHSGGLTTRPA